MKRQKKQKEPEVLRDTSNLSEGTKRLSIAAICALSLLLGFIAGAVVWVVLRIMSLGIDALWTWLPDALGCGRSLVYCLAVCVIGGLIIGFVQRQVGPLPDNMEQVMGRVKLQGGYPYDRLHVIAICALLPLIFGGALGPEAGLSGLVAGLCCWVGDRLKCKGDEVVALAEAGFAATLGVIFHAPLFGIAMDLESDTEHLASDGAAPSGPAVDTAADGSAAGGSTANGPAPSGRTRIVKKTTRVIIYCFAVFGGMLAFGLLGKFLGGGSGLPRFNPEHTIGLSQWKWFIPLLALGIVFSLLYMLVERITGKLNDKLMNGEAAGAKSWRTVISCVIPGICMGLVGYFHPLTMFSGEHQLSELIVDWKAASPQELILTAVLKLVLVSLCINFGWRGGSIFPIIFSGACVGYAFALIVGMDGAFAAAIVIAALYAYQMRKPVAVIMVLLLCFPITYIIPVGVAAFIGAKIPSPFAKAGKAVIRAEAEA